MRHTYVFLGWLIFFTGAGYNARAENGKDMLTRMTKDYREKHISEDARQKAEDDHLRQQARDLEAVYLRQILNEAFPDGEDGGLYGDTASTGVYRFMFIEQTAAQWAESGEAGLADMLYDDMKKEPSQRMAPPREPHSFPLPKRR